MAERGTNKILIGYLCAIGTEIIFGMSYIFTKQGVNEASTFALLGCRICFSSRRCYLICNLQYPCRERNAVLGR